MKMVRLLALLVVISIIVGCEEWDFNIFSDTNTTITEANDDSIILDAGEEGGAVTGKSNVDEEGQLLIGEDHDSNQDEEAVFPPSEGSGM